LQPVTLDQVSEPAKHAVLAAEDANFYDHPGVDAAALVRAADAAAPSIAAETSAAGESS
jgi:membrane carboxypeptidase/penicillin-binding protein